MGSVGQGCAQHLATGRSERGDRNTTTPHTRHLTPVLDTSTNPPPVLCLLLDKLVGTKAGCQECEVRAGLKARNLLTTVLSPPPQSPPPKPDTPCLSGPRLAHLTPPLLPPRHVLPTAAHMQGVAMMPGTQTRAWQTHSRVRDRHPHVTVSLVGL